MGEVYLAEHVASRRRVALKTLSSQGAMDRYQRDSFQREIENTRALRHPNIVAMYEWGFSGDSGFLAMEYCDQGSAMDLLNKAGVPLSVLEALKIVRQVLQGLEYAHHAPIPFVKLRDGGYGPGQGLVHRDLKPANIFLVGATNSYTAKVGDFGLSKAFALAGLSGQTRTGIVAGSPWFMPRQQIENYKGAKPEVDVWAVAASLYFLLTRCPPRDFSPGGDPWQTVLDSNPVPIRTRNPSLPAGLSEVIDWALIDRPAIVCKSAAELARALQSVTA